MKIIGTILLGMIMLASISLSVLADSGNGNGILRLDSKGREKSIAVGGVGDSYFEGRGIMKVTNADAEICDLEGDAVVTWTGDGIIVEPVNPDGCKSYMGFDTVRVEGDHFTVDANTLGEYGQLTGIGSGYIILEGNGWYIY